MIHTVLAIGHYEDRITVATHGEPDVKVAAFAYDLFAYAVNGLGDVLGAPDAASVARELMWVLALILAVAAVSMWLYRLREPLRMDRATRAWLGATVLLKVMSVVYTTVAAPPNPSVGGVLATRPVAYPLWIASTVVLVVAAHRFARTIRQTAVK